MTIPHIHQYVNNKLNVSVSSRNRVDIDSFEISYKEMALMCMNTERGWCSQLNGVPVEKYIGKPNITHTEPNKFTVEVTDTTTTVTTPTMCVIIKSGELIVNNSVFYTYIALVNDLDCCATRLTPPKDYLFIDTSVYYTPDADIDHLLVGIDDKLVVTIDGKQPTISLANLIDIQYELSTVDNFRKLDVVRDESNMWVVTLTLCGDVITKLIEYKNSPEGLLINDILHPYPLVAADVNKTLYAIDDNLVPF